MVSREEVYQSRLKQDSIATNMALCDAGIGGNLYETKELQRVLHFQKGLGIFGSDVVAEG